MTCPFVTTGCQRQVTEETAREVCAKVDENTVMCEQPKPKEPACFLALPLGCN